MKKDFSNNAILCEKLLDKCGGDYAEALATIRACADSFLSLGNWQQAEKMDQFAKFFVSYFNL